MASFLDEATLDLEALARLLLKPGCSFHLNIQQSNCDNHKPFESYMSLILEMVINISVRDTLVHNNREQVDPEEQCTGSLLIIDSHRGLLNSLTEYHCSSHVQQQGKLMQLYHSKTTLELSHMALNHAIAASESNEDHDSMAFKEQMNLIVSQVEVSCFCSFMTYWHQLYQTTLIKNKICHKETHSFNYGLGSKGADCC